MRSRGRVGALGRIDGSIKLLKGRGCGGREGEGGSRVGNLGGGGDGEGAEGGGGDVVNWQGVSRACGMKGEGR